MKKLLTLLLVLVLMLAMMLTGCGGSESTDSDKPEASQTKENPEDSNTAADADTEGMGDLLSGTYVDMMKSNEYLMSYKATMDFDGQLTEVESTIAVKGDDMAMNSNMQGMVSVIIIKDDTVYMVDHASKTVTSMAQPQDGASSMETGAIDMEGITYVGNGKEEGLVYEEYSTAETNVRYYFDGKELKKIATTIGGQTIIMDILELSTDVPASMFDIPAGYQEIKM